MSQTTSPFAAKTVLAVLAIGASAFLLFLYALGAGWDGVDEQAGEAHAASVGLNGYAGLVALLERQGREVTVSRSEQGLRREALLVLTPTQTADVAAMAAVIVDRRSYGPTLVILPKWAALPASDLPRVEAPDGWVMLAGASAPEWLPDLPGLRGAELVIAEQRAWQGLGLQGRFPSPGQVMGFQGAPSALVRGRGELAFAAFAERGSDEDWPILVVAEPDLLNNYGLADLERTRVAVALIDAATEGEELPIVFDMTVVGLGRGKNLLTLAFEPPFLAATLCLLLAALLVAWRAFQRFGPPRFEAPAMALGKRQLATNGADLIVRSNRMRLLGAPYAALLADRIAARLGIAVRQPEQRDHMAASVLSQRRLLGDYQALLNAVRQARKPGQLLRAAQALKAVETVANERMLS